MFDDDPLAKTISDWSEVFMHHSFHEFKHFMDESGLSPSQVGTLMRLHHFGPCGISEVGIHLGVTNAASSQLVERLVQQGLIERPEDPVDRRARQLALTEKGQSLVQAGIDSRRSWMQALTCELTSAEQDAIIAALRLLTEAAKKLEGDR
jgi:DNA-binding MarR family transcriptional regulator